GSGDDTLNLEATHNDRDPLGGFNATFTFNGGDGNETVNVGQAVTGGKTLDLIDIFTMINGQGGDDTVIFEHTASIVANTLAFVGKTFAELFPASTEEWLNIFANIFNESSLITQAALFTTVALGLVASPTVRVMNMGAHTREVENLFFSFGSGDDVFKLNDAVYREAITVNGGAGADTFNIPNGVTTQQMVTLNGGAGDDIAVVDFSAWVPNSTITLTYNGGEHDPLGEGDLLRFMGDGVATVAYQVSSTQARAGAIITNGNTFAFTGVEPLVVNGFASLDMLGADNINEFAIESIPVDDMDLTSLVLHVLLVDGVISWRQQVKLDGIGAKETTSYGQALSWDGDTLVVGARRSVVSITDEKPVSRTIVDFVKSNNVAAGQTSLASGTYYIEMRDVGGSDWEFRLLDASNAAVSIADVTGGAALIAGWQDVPDNKVIDTLRGLLVAFGPVEADYKAVAGTGAASFNYSVGLYPGVVYVYVQSGGAWSEQAKLYPDDVAYAGQGFGDSVSLSGNTLVVGAPQDVSLGSNAGSAYIFQRSGAEWSQIAKLKANDGAVNDRFGASVAANGAAGAVVVGAPGDDGDAGAAYVFNSSGAQLAKLTASDRASNDLFGTALDYAGSTIAIGAPGDDGGRGSAYIYSGSWGSWTQTQKLISTSAQAGEQFGTAVAMDTFIVIGAPGYDGKNPNQGAAFVYHWTGSWTLSARLTADGGLPEALAQNEGRPNDHFGASVTTSGEYVVVGAPDYDDVSLNQGAIYFFRYLPDQGSGAGYSWIRSQNKMVSSTPTENDYFGQELALYGLQLAVGIPGFNETDANNNILREDVGTVRFYQTNGVIALNSLSDGTIGLYRADITNLSGTNAGYEMIYHVASRTLLVGAYGSGAVYVYADEGLSWRHIQTMALGWGRYGYDMDLYGDTLVVGAPDANAIYVYTYGGGPWNYAWSTRGPGPDLNSGASVALGLSL
nr:FG-GAP repeat protein [Alphaproteobacteria bacterium]